MKHILNNLSDEEKNSIREQHMGGMKVVTENFSKLIKSKLGDVKPILSEQDLIGMANQILTGFGDSNKKVKEFCTLCKKYSKSQPNGLSNRFADIVRDAIQGAGTNEESIYHVFESLADFDQFCSLVKSYQQSYNVDLYTDLSSDISDESEWVRIMRPVRNLLTKARNPSYNTKATQMSGTTSNPSGRIPNTTRIKGPIGR